MGEARTFWRPGPGRCLKLLCESTWLGRAERGTAERGAQRSASRGLPRRARSAATERGSRRAGLLSATRMRSAAVWPLGGARGAQNGAKSYYQ